MNVMTGDPMKDSAIQTDIPEFSLRFAQESDASLILYFIIELARY